MRGRGQIDYVELPGGRLDETRRFYGAAFGWRFVDCALPYVAVEGAGVDAGVLSEPGVSVEKRLGIRYAEDLDVMQSEVEAAGGKVLKPIYSFPGGRRFHFEDPAGNELAVYTDA